MEEPDRFEALLKESQKFCIAVGLHKELILEIYADRSDWAFILKVDSLLETAAKEIVCRGLKMDLGDLEGDKDELKDFVYSLPMNGRISVLGLLKIVQCPPNQLGFIECVRLLRNMYAHNIKNADATLITIIQKHKEKSRLIKFLSQIEEYEESDLIETYQKDGGLLKYGILNGTMVFLTMGYHVAVKI